MSKAFTPPCKQQYVFWFPLSGVADQNGAFGGLKAYATILFWKFTLVQGRSQGFHGSKNSNQEQAM